MAVTQGIDSNGDLVKNDSYYNSTGKSDKSSNSSLDKSAFLNLLVAEMKYQDPLNPSSNTDYVAQLATFSQVESMQNMQLTYQQQQGAGLIGKPVIMKTETSSGETGYICGRVDYMITEKDKVYLSINGKNYDIDDLDTVLEEEYYKKYVLKEDTTDNNTDTKTDTNNDTKTDSSEDTKTDDTTEE